MAADGGSSTWRWCSTILMLTEQTVVDRFARVLSPKVVGAWNLHELTEGQALDAVEVFLLGFRAVGLDGVEQLRGGQHVPRCFGSAAARGRAGRAEPGLGSVVRGGPGRGARHRKEGAPGPARDPMDVADRGRGAPRARACAARGAPGSDAARPRSDAPALRRVGAADRAGAGAGAGATRRDGRYQGRGQRGSRRCCRWHAAQRRPARRCSADVARVLKSMRRAPLPLDRHAA